MHFHVKRSRGQALCNFAGLVCIRVAKMEKQVVTTNTGTSLILRTSGSEFAGPKALAPDFAVAMGQTGKVITQPKMAVMATIIPYPK